MHGAVNSKYKKYIMILFVLKSKSAANTSGISNEISENNNLFNFTPITAEDIKKAIKDLPNNASSGIDCINSKMLKLSANSIASSLTVILTINYDLLLGILQSCGINGRALAWFSSYLQNRSQCTK